MSFLSLVCSDNVLAYDRISYGWWDSLPRFDPVFSLFGERLRVWPSFLWMIIQTSMCRPCHTVYVAVVGFVCPYVRTTLEKVNWKLHTSWLTQQKPCKNMMTSKKFLKTCFLLLLNGESVINIKPWPNGKTWTYRSLESY